MRFEGKVALITAVASGIGRATADIMAREGAIIVGVDNHAERLDKTVSEIAAGGGQAHGRLCNALDKDEVDPLVASVAKEFGRIDILVNAVGGSTIVRRPSATVDELSLDDWKKLIDFNLDGTFLFTHAVVPIMKRQKSGKIVNLASIAGRGRSVESSGAYAAAKGGIIAFTKKLCYELGPYGITVNCIAPGFILSNPTTQLQWDGYGPDGQRALVDGIAMRRIGQPTDIANGVSFFASERSGWVTGQIIAIDGGSAFQ